MELRIEHGKWSTYDACKKEAAKYTTRSEFCKMSPGAYASARKNGWLEDICVHMPQVSDWRNKDAVAKEAAKYHKRSQFERGSSGAYNSARKNLWLDELFPKR
jgi:hypothetical protein